MKRHHEATYNSALPAPQWEGATYLNAAHPPISPPPLFSQSIPAPHFSMPQYGSVNQSIYQMQQLYAQQAQSQFHANYNYGQRQQQFSIVLQHSGGNQNYGVAHFGNDGDNASNNSGLTLIDFLDSLNRGAERSEYNNNKRSKSTNDRGENFGENLYQTNAIDGENKTDTEEAILQPLDSDQPRDLSKETLATERNREREESGTVMRSSNNCNNNSKSSHIGDSSLSPINRLRSVAPSKNDGDEASAKFHQFTQFSSVSVRDLPMENGIEETECEKEGRNGSDEEGERSMVDTGALMSEFDTASRMKSKPSPDDLFAIPSQLGTQSFHSPHSLHLEEEPNATICQVCREKEMKYKCPACRMRTCSLACSQRHKADSGCNGKQGVSTFVPLDEMADDTLMADLKYLEGSKKMLEEAKKSLHVRQKVPKESNWKPIYETAKANDTKIRRMKKEMPRRKNNKSKFSVDSNCICWQVEWCFHLSLTSDIIYIESMVDEVKTFESALNSLLLLHQTKLAPFLAQEPNRSEWAVLMKNSNRDGGSMFFRFDLSNTIRKSLSGLTVWEYPSFHIFFVKDLPQFELYNTLFFDHVAKLKRQEEEASKVREAEEKLVSSCMNGAGK